MHWICVESNTNIYRESNL